MAFYDDQDQEELGQQGQQAPQAQTQPSGQSGIISGQGASPGQGTQAANTPDNPGNFVGIKQYLDANKNQATKLGGQVSGLVQQDVDTARSDLSNLENKFNTAVDQSTTQNDQGIVSSIQNNQAETLTPEQRSQAQTQYNAQYQGPTNLVDLTDDYLQAQKSIAKASENLNAMGTEEGRKGLVNQLNPAQRTQGMNTFDAALLQSGSGRDVLAKMSEDNKDIGNILGNASTAANQKATTSQAQTEAARQAIRDAIGQRVQAQDDPSTPDIDESKGTGAFGSLIQRLRDQAATTNAATPGQYNAQIADTADNRVSADLLASLGLTAGQNLYNLDINQYIKQNPAAANIQNMATAEDVARYQALLEMAGLSGEGDSTLTQAGSYNPIIYDTAGLKQALADKTSAYKSALASTSNQIKDSMGYLASGGYNIGNMGLDPSKIGTDYNSAKAQLDAFENYMKRTGQTDFLNFLNGAAPPGNWNWDGGVQSRYRERYRFYHQLRDYVNRLGAMNPNRIIGTN